MAGSDLTIVNSTVYSYRDELIVEVTTRDLEEDLVVLSYQFEYVEPNAGVTPKQPVDDAVRETVAEALSNDDYRWL